MFSIQLHCIGDDSPCFIVAEAGLAHNGKLENAYKLVDMAAEAKCDAVKFQVYRTKELISKERSPEWFDRYQKKELPYEDFAKIQEYAMIRNIVFFATPHTISAFEYLKSIDVPCYKVGSGDHMTDFIDKIADTGKPLIISTGLRTHYEVLNLIDRYGRGNTAFLHCVTAYPVIEPLLNLRFIDAMKRHAAASHSIIGYSDHSGGTHACELAVAIGAKIIEKHICLEESEGQDVAVSVKSTKDLLNFVKAIRQVETMAGSEFRQYSAEERANEKWALKSQSDGRRPV
jgi:N-acetylneuraminate synthase/N,N'-diacetyllegionaminate synthase